MKKIFLLIIFLFSLLFSSSAFAIDNDWIYAGRFGLLVHCPVSHNLDMYVINHLTTFRGTSSFPGPGSQLPYDVYYKHDHSMDTGDNQHEYNNHSFQFQVKIVPLNIFGKIIGSGISAGTIVCSYNIAEKGSYRIVMKSYKIFDTKTHQQLFNAEGDFDAEQLYIDSAAETILKESSPHPVFAGLANQLNGTEYYKYR